MPTQRSAKALALGAWTGGQHHLGALGAEEVVEGATELGIPITQDILHAASLLAEHQQQVAGLLGTQAPFGLVVTPARWTRRVASSVKNNTYTRRNHPLSTARKSQARIPAACWRRNLRASEQGE